jgi:hypothetical protein
LCDSIGCAEKRKKDRKYCQKHQDPKKRIQIPFPSIFHNPEVKPELPEIAPTQKRSIVHDTTVEPVLKKSKNLPKIDLKPEDIEGTDFECFVKNILDQRPNCIETGCDRPAIKGRRKCYQHRYSNVERKNCHKDGCNRLADPGRKFCRSHR